MISLVLFGMVLQYNIYLGEDTHTHTPDLERNILSDRFYILPVVSLVQTGLQCNQIGKMQRSQFATWHSE